MCGIVGFITDEKSIGASERKRWFINALRADVVRGDDGTGAFLVEHDHGNGRADWCKRGTPPDAFFETEHAEERFGIKNDFDKYRAVIGHNRSATVGDVSTTNAHPFQEGPITLVHNGTLTSTHSLPTPKHKLKGADVDSHMICHNLATHSVADVVKQLDGAFVLVWHDSRDQSVNIIRNDRRPLHLLPLKYHKTILIASEAEMLWWLTQRSTFTPGENIYFPQPGHLMQFLPDQGIKPKITKLDMYTGWIRSGGRYSEGWDNDGPWARGGGYNSTRLVNLDQTRTEGPNTGKGPRPPQQEGPMINTAALNRKLPRTITRTLETANLMALDKLRMAVDMVTPVHGTTSCVVRGRLVDLEPPRLANIYGLMYEAVKGAEREETWTVAPIGLKAVGAQQEVVLARLLARSSVPPRAGSPPVNLLAAPSSTSLAVGSDDGSTDDEEGEDYDTIWDAMSKEEQERMLEEETYFSPDGEEITLSQWRDAVLGGCMICHKEIDPYDAPEMFWDTETKLPLCAECHDVLIEKGEGTDIDYSWAV